ncbi:MAG: hypothetical protein D6689_09665 [Deltaproteobacteria bacterium]|nr:MAG: hypothetical protein D6689_09665 [Deltaproteobacteria bacterium]
MGYTEARELARIRQQLRDRLMSQRREDVAAILERLRQVADNEQESMPELRGEYERWKLRFDLLDAFSAA